MELSGGVYIIKNVTVRIKDLFKHLRQSFFRENSEGIKGANYSTIKLYHRCLIGFSYASVFTQ